MSQDSDFEELFLKYWEYVYKYEVKHSEDFNPDIPWYQRKDFKEQLEEEGLKIKIREGY